MKIAITATLLFLAPAAAQAQAVCVRRTGWLID